MKPNLNLLRKISFFFCIIHFSLCYTQNTTVSIDTSEINSRELNEKNDSINEVFLNTLKERLENIEQLRINDSIEKAKLENELKSLKTTDNLKKEDLQHQLDELQQKEADRIAQKKDHINSLKALAKAHPVLGPNNDDTLFLIYNNIGSFTAQDRAKNITNKIKMTYDDDFFNADSIHVTLSDDTYTIIYKDIIIMSISEIDALWHNQEASKMAEEYSLIIKTSIEKTKKDNSLPRVLMRIGLVLLVLAGAYFIIWGISKLYYKALKWFKKNGNEYLKNLSYKNYTIISTEQEMKVIAFFLKVFRWAFIIFAIYFILPLLFSIFPATRDWADYLFGLIWNPFRKVLLAIWHYLPNIFTILVIYFVIKYIIRFIKYIFSEIQSENLKISGFHPDWAMPTFQIVRVVLIAFGFVIIFPYLPGSDSPIFAGVSVFLGLLVSLGSTSAISNIIAGLVITYMRPFKIGDRIKLGDSIGEVIEKNTLVTRLRTPKNEEITIPNSAILSGNTVNYSSYIKNEGLIIHTNVTMGYEFAWEDIYAALIEAANRTEDVLKEPKPFVLHTSLEDFYVSYQLNAYIYEANKQARIYSDLHRHIQDVFNERGFEMLSPSYVAGRDGNAPAFPKKYLFGNDKNSKANVKTETDNDNDE